MSLPDDAVALLRRLLTTRRTLALAVVADGEPIIGLLPFAADAGAGLADGGARGGSALLVHASGLARHARGLRPGFRFDALLAEDDAPGVDPLAVPRATLRGTVAVPEAGSPEHAAARAAYVARFPAAERLLGFGDFALYRLEVEAGRLIAGFAAAADVGPGDVVRALSPD